MKTIHAAIALTAYIWLAPTSPAEPDQDLRKFLGVHAMDVTATIPADHEAYFFEVVIFENRKEVARLPTNLMRRAKGDEEVIRASLMFQNTPLVKMIQPYTSNNLTDRYDGWSAFQSGHTLSSEPLGNLGDLLILRSLCSGTIVHEKFKVVSDLEMKGELLGTLSDYKTCVLVGIASGPDHDDLRQRFLTGPQPRRNGN
jgi:hypothetical protein